MSMVAFFPLPPTGDRQEGDFRTVSQVPREQLRRGKPGEWTGALPAGARLSICLGRWRGVWWCGYPWRVITPPLRKHLLLACQQPRQPPPPPVPPQTSTSAPKDGGRRYTAHDSMLGSCFWSPPAMPDAVQPRQQQIRMVQAGLLRPQRPLRVLGAMAAGPTGDPSFFIPARSMVHGCHGGATRFDTLLDFSDTLGYAAGRILHVETGQDVG